MKQKIILISMLSLCVVISQSQDKGKKPVTAYAITASEIGGNRWNEVRKIDLLSGEVLQSVYKNGQEVSVLNARTGKAIKQSTADTDEKITRKIIIIHDEQSDPSGSNNTLTEQKEPIVIKKVIYKGNYNPDKPFSTLSAACAFDKKHGRLYYTPMGINQLRYIDLESKDPAIYYFEGESFGALNGRGDIPNQVTRMVIGADGNGYALTNSGDHLIRFGTRKRQEIKDLGALTDDPSNGDHSIHGKDAFGGDLIAAESGDLILVTAHNAVFRINIKDRLATYTGTIKGLPKGYTTNGAVAEEGSSIIVCSSTSTLGYYKFDLQTLQAEKYKEEGSVYNASDLANANLVSEKKIKQDKTEPVIAFVPESNKKDEQLIPDDKGNSSAISVYPNPVSESSTNISFIGFKPGKYEVQLLDLSGKIVQITEIMLQDSRQLIRYRLPRKMSRGTYLVSVKNEAGHTMVVDRLLVQ